MSRQTLDPESDPEQGCPQPSVQNGLGQAWLQSRPCSRLAG